MRKNGSSCVTYCASQSMIDEASAKPPRRDPQYLIVGQAVAPSGVKGEIKVNVLTEFPDRFLKLKEVVLVPFSSIEPGLAPRASLNPATLRPPAIDQKAARPQGSQTVRPPDGPTPFTIEAIRSHKGQIILKLVGVDDAVAAATLRGYWLVVPVEQASKLPRDAYYIYQLVGLEVYTTEGERLGKVEDVLTTSANDVYVVRGSGVEDPTGELLIPAIKSVVKEIEIDAGRVVVAPPQEWM
jgi:16S rRNA processing protein RimM